MHMGILEWRVHFPASSDTRLGYITKLWSKKPESFQKSSFLLPDGYNAVMMAWDSADILDYKMEIEDGEAVRLKESGSSWWSATLNSQLLYVNYIQIKLEKIIVVLL